MGKSKDFVTQIPEPPFSRFLFSDTRISLIWFLLRLYIGYEWIVAGWAKIASPMWTGSQSGVALQGFLLGALKKTAGPHPDVSSWYGELIKNVALHNTALISHIVSYGEVLVGVALILGAFTGIAAFLGAFMNMNYLFAGTVSTNPFMFVIQLFLILAWRVAGWIGADRYLLPFIGVPWHKGKLSKKD